MNNLDVSNPRFLLPLENIYFGAQCKLFISEMQVNNSDLRNFRLKSLDFYIEFSKHIKPRFDFKDEYLNFAKILDPSVVFSDESLRSFLSLAVYFFFANIKMLRKLIRSGGYLNSQNLFKYDTVEEFWRQVFLTKNVVDESVVKKCNDWVSVSTTILGCGQNNIFTVKFDKNDYILKLVMSCCIPNKC